MTRRLSSPTAGLLCFALGVGSVLLWHSLRAGTTPDHSQAHPNIYYELTARETAAFEARLRAEMSRHFLDDLERARRLGPAYHLPAFDEKSLPPAESRPVLGADEQRSPYPLDVCSSLLGNLGLWVSQRGVKDMPPSADVSLAGGVVVNVRLGRVSEQYREYQGGRVLRYALSYVVDGQTAGAQSGGADCHLRPVGTVLLEE